MRRKQPENTGLIKDPLISRKQLAAILGVNEITIFQWDSAGKGVPMTRLGRLVRYRASDVEEWLKDQRNKSQP